MNTNDHHVLHALRSLGVQRMIKPIAELAEVSPSTAGRSLRRLELRGLINVHRVELKGRDHIRWIVPVDIRWRAHGFPTRGTADLASLARQFGAATSSEGADDGE